MAKRKRIRSTDPPEETLRARRSRRARKLVRRLGLLLLLLVGLLAAAPTIVGKTALRNTLLAKALPSGWVLESEQASLGWSSSQSLAGVTIVDAEGKQLLAVESMTLPKSLLSLAMNQTDLGEVELVRPVAYLETWPEGSNWEEFLAGLEQHTAEQQEEAEVATERRPTEITLKVVEGTVHGLDQATGRRWSLSGANVSAAIGSVIQVNVSAQLSTLQPARQGQLKFSWQPIEGGMNQVELLAERLPLGPLEPWLARVLPEAQLSGTVSADAKMAWAFAPNGAIVMNTFGRIEASQINASVQALQGDRLVFDRLVMPWQLSLQNGNLSIDEFNAKSEWAELDAQGHIPVDQLQRLRFDGVKGEAIQFSGQANLAKLAKMLPRTLQLREGVNIDSGQLTFHSEAHPQGDCTGWLGSIKLENVLGSNGGRQVRWDQPIQMIANWQDSAVGLRMEQLTLDAPFAKAKVNSEQQAIAGTFELDLDQLSRELGQFVDMQAWQLRGLGEGAFTLRRQANQQFVAEANVDLTDLHVTEGARQVWVEPKLQVELRATGTEQDFSPRVIATGKLQLRGPRDQFELDLLEPVDLRDAKRPWQVQVDGNGPLRLWASRLRPWVAAMPEQLAGDAHLKARVQVAADRVEVMESTGSVVQLRVQSDSMTINEPRVEFAGDVLWDAQTKSLTTRQMQLQGSSFSFRARDVAVALAAPGAPTARGSVAFQADLERLSAMAGLVGQQAATWPQGTAVGQMQLTSSAYQLQADFGVKIKQLKLVRTTAASGAVYGRPEIVWTEPALETTGVAKYLMASDRVQLENLQVRGKTLRLNSSASLDRVSTERLLQASGLLEYDPQELAKLVTSYGGGAVQLQGDQQVRFQIAGSLSDSTTHWSNRWNAAAEAGWSSAGAYGLPLGGGRLQGNLRAGQLQMAPLDIAVGKGRLTAQPQIRLTPGAQQLVLPRGPLITNVEISPEVSEAMLKYVAPILAGATRTEGQFSVNLELAEIPLRHPKQGRLQGQLAVQRLNVTAGPMMDQLITLVSQIEALTKRKQFLQASASPSNKKLLTVAERQIDFQVVDGRVYHRNLEFLIDNTPVRSYGSVGFDQTLALMIEVPIQDKWIEREPALRSFAGQSLQIPIRGTFQKPKIDERAVANLSAQLLQGAATQAIGDELNKQFEKLFRGK